MLEFRRTLTLRQEDLDGHGNIRPGRILYYFQEIASDHADALGFGFDPLIAKNMIWVLSKVKYRIYGSFAPGQAYQLMSCPLQKKPRAVIYERDYYIRNAEGDLLAAGTSYWCIVNAKTRRVERTDFDFPGEYPAEKAFGEGIEKIHAGELTLAGRHLVTEADLDKNQHTNNCRYADMVAQVSGEVNHRQFLMNFSRETRPGDEILLYRGASETADGITVAGKLADGTTVFQALVK